MGFFNESFNEWAARRAGRKAMSHDFQKATRHIIGPTGYQWSTAWKQLEDEDGSYLKSFDPRIPPSIHISHRDKAREGIIMPISERCIEDWNDQHTDPVDKQA